MVMRVATFALSDQMVAGALRTQATMANLQVQESSGLKSETLGGYGSDARHVINLQVSVTRAQSYIDAATLTDSKVQVMYSAVGSMVRRHHPAANAAQCRHQRQQHRGGIGDQFGAADAVADGLAAEHAI